MTREELQAVRDRAWLEGASHAYGTLQGLGELTDAGRQGRVTTLKRAIFGTSNRKLSTANTLIAEAAAKVEAVEDETLLAVRDITGERLIER